MDGVINFSDFFKKDGKKLPEFNKEDILNDFWIEDGHQIENESQEQVESDFSEDLVLTNESVEKNEDKSGSFLDKEEMENMIKKEVERLKLQTIKENQNLQDSIELPIQVDDEQINENSQENYKVYNDKSETFSCDIQLEGANLKDTEVRLILESDNWNLMFPGEIDSSGKVTIPIRKLNLFEEGVKGKIKMEVIAEGTVFVPWEDTFEVKMSKKVMVKFNENKSQKPKNPSTPTVKVNLKK